MAGNASYFSIGTVSLSTTQHPKAKKKKKACDIFKAARHNLREIQAELGASERINPLRSHLNRVMHGPKTAQGVHEAAQALLQGVDTSRLKRDHVQALEAVFDVPGHDVPEGYFERCTQWLQSALGLPILSVVLHSDEKNAHIHALMLPVQDGRHIGGSLRNKENIKRLRDVFFNEVATPAGFARGNAKLRGAMKTLGVDAVLFVLRQRGLPECLGDEAWEVFEALVRYDPTPLVEAFGIDLAQWRLQTSEAPIGLQPAPASTIGLHQHGDQNQALTECRASRFSTASKALHSAEVRLGLREAPPMEVPYSEATTRVRDDHAHDTAHWH